MHRRESYGSNFSVDEEEFNPSSEEPAPQHYRLSESKAMRRLEKARMKPVAFAVRSNIEFDCSADDDSPLHGFGVSFGVRAYLHIKEKYNDEWWIGRIVQEGCDLGFIPSPVKLEKMHGVTASKSNFSGGETPATPSTPGGESTDNTIMEQSNDSSTKMQGPKVKAFFKKQDTVQPYDTVPCIRPIVIIGPSLKGYEVTDMMQKAVFDFLKHNFEPRMIITRIEADISLAKKLPQNESVSKSAPSKLALLDRSKNAAFAVVQSEIDRIFELAKEQKLLVLDCDTVNHPAQLSKSPLFPIVVYIRVASQKVLQRLIKSRGQSQKRAMNFQMVAAEKLGQCEQEMFDLILDENQLEEACEHFSEFLNGEWRAVHPPIITGPPKIVRPKPSLLSPESEIKRTPSGRTLPGSRRPSMEVQNYSIKSALPVPLVGAHPAALVPSNA